MSFSFKFGVKNNTTTNKKRKPEKSNKKPENKYQSNKIYTVYTIQQIRVSLNFSSNNNTNNNAFE